MSDAPAARLMLFTPELAETETFQPLLQAALGAGDVAAVVIRLKPADDRTRIARAKPLIEAAQAAGAAALLAGENVDDIVGKSGADGVHAPAEDAAFADAIERFKPEKIVGAGALRTRDGAMSAGEAGADYVCFGENDEPFSATLERVEWWAPIFQTPCVALALSPDDAGPLAAAGAEFVALDEAVWLHPDGPAAAVAKAEAMIALTRAPSP